jgi:hypothetical protein
MKKKYKIGAMEMSMGTIVTIVLLVSVLVMGIFFIQKISKSATGVIDLTDQQLRDQVNKLFSEDKEIVIYPGTRYLEIKQTTSDGIGLGIKNLGNADTFSYDVKATPGNNCPDSFKSEDALNLISIGGTEEGIELEAGGFAYRKVLFDIPTGTPLCVVRFSLNVDSTSGRKFGDFFDVKIKAK